MSEEKPVVSKEETFDRLDIRTGRIVSIEPASDSPKAAYIIKADFGKNRFYSGRSFKTGRAAA